MEPEYLNISLDSSDVLRGIKASADKILERLKADIPTKRKPGGLNEITDLRTKTATMLGVTFGQICGLTSGWSVAELYAIYHASEQWPNPPALWWVIYKKKKVIYGRINKKEIPGVGKKGREQDEELRQGTLF